MANIYCASSFMLPEQWPTKAKELFAALVELFDDGDSEEKCIEFLAEKGIKIDEASLEQLTYDRPGLVMEIDKGDKQGELPPSKWRYYFYNDENFNPDVVQILLDIVTELYKIPYKNRIEVNWCVYSDRPGPNDFSGDVIVSYHEDFSMYTDNKAFYTNPELSAALEDVRKYYVNQIEQFNWTDKNKSILTLSCNELFTALVNVTNGIGSMEEKSKYSLDAVMYILQKDVYNTLLKLKHNLELSD